MTRRLAPLLIVLTALAACSGEAGGTPDEPADFRSLAAAHCAEVVNDHLLTEPHDAGVEVLAATLEDEEPTEEQVTTWSGQLQAEVDRLESIREALAELSSDDTAEDGHWQAIVTGGEADVEVLRDRVELLQTEEWDEVRDKIEPRPAPSAPAEEAIIELGLDRTDCQWVHSPAVVGPGSEDFVREATTACTDIANRRHSADFDADSRETLDLVLEIFQDGPPEEFPDGSVAALTRVHDEWVRTVEDLESVNAEDVGDPGAWADTLDAARERVDIFRDRVEAAESGDAASVTEAFEVGRGDHPGPGFEELGLGNRSCAGVQF